MQRIRRRGKESAIHRLYQKYIWVCSKKNVYWGITEELFNELTSSDCAYCGKPPTTSVQARSYPFTGIDRKDPDLGYLETNVVPCCTECNFIKGCRLTFEEMKVVGAALAKYRKYKWVPKKK